MSIGEYQNKLSIKITRRTQRTGARNIQKDKLRKGFDWWFRDSREREKAGIHDNLHFQLHVMHGC